MKKFRLTMWVGNCENFGTEWEETRREVEIIEAESKEELLEEYNDTIHDCDVKSYYIEELGVPCYKVIWNEKCVGQYENLEDAVREFEYCCFYYGYDDDRNENFKKAVGKVRIEIGIRE